MCGLKPSAPGHRSYVIKRGSNNGVSKAQILQIARARTYDNKLRNRNYTMARRRNNELQNSEYNMADIRSKMTKEALDLSHREWCKKNISILESHMQVINNQRMSSGRGDDMSITMNELKRGKELFEELLYPKLQWNCTKCTYLNSPIHFNCEICESRKPAEITIAMSVQLQTLLSKQGQDEQEIVSLFDPVLEEKSAALVKKLESKVAEDLDWPTEDSYSVFELEETNMDQPTGDSYWLIELEETNANIRNKINDEENTLKSCVDLTFGDPKDWSVAMVSTWLFQLGVPQYQEAFADACIDGEKLLSTGKSNLEKLGVHQKDCSLILNAIAKLEARDHQFNNSKNLASYVQSQHNNVFCVTRNTQEFIHDDSLSMQLSRKLVKCNEPVSNRNFVQKLSVSSGDFVDYPDEE